MRGDSREEDDLGVLPLLTKGLLGRVKVELSRAPSYYSKNNTTNETPREILKVEVMEAPWKPVRASTIPEYP